MSHKQKQGELMNKWICAMMLSIASFQLQAVQAEEGYVPVESRPFTHAEKLAVIEERAQEPKEAQFQLNREMSVGHGDMGVKYHSVHPGAYHRLVATTTYGDALEFEDGTVWATYPGHRYICVTWTSLDSIVIVQNTDPFSSYLFTLINVATNQKVDVNMARGPLYKGPNSYWIKAINSSERKVVLNDNSVWDLSRWDYQVYSRWFIEDHIILGVNDGTLTSFNPNILINVNTLNFSRASLDK